MRPHGLEERYQQSDLKERRVALILDQMMREPDGFEVAVHGERWMRLWWPHRDEKHQRQKMKELVSAASFRLGHSFERGEVARKMNVKLEAGQRHYMRQGRYDKMAALMQVQMKVVGLGDQPGDHSTQIYAPQTVQAETVVVQQPNGERIVRSPAIAAMFRGIEREPEAPKPAEDDERKSIFVAPENAPE